MCLSVFSNWDADEGLMRVKSERDPMQTVSSRHQTICCTKDTNNSKAIVDRS
jgi:hypothetical protein